LAANAIYRWRLYRDTTPSTALWPEAIAGVRSSIKHASANGAAHLANDNIMGKDFEEPVR
jgi:hypothetical protein